MPNNETVEIESWTWDTIGISSEMADWVLEKLGNTIDFGRDTIFRQLPGRGPIVELLASRFVTWKRHSGRVSGVNGMTWDLLVVHVSPDASIAAISGNEANTEFAVWFSDDNDLRCVCTPGLREICLHMEAEQAKWLDPIRGTRRANGLLGTISDPPVKN